MNVEMVVIAAVIGALAGCLTGFGLKGGGYGLVADTTLGVAGGVAGGLAVWMSGIAPGGPRLAIIGAALVGAIVLIVLQRKYLHVETAAAR
ncbi:MAG TPA: GlsB/YeaQ/YmgE family stress response membrane protein [Methylomirabilota bacterium]|jgi:uncharacterized membrane protein YeaQ/YmgE (transglycosylase-associated protein family)